MTNKTEPAPALVDELLPCPFCDGPAQLACGGPGLHFVRCEGCTASTDDGSRERAVRLWNTRTHATAIRERDEARALLREAREDIDCYRSDLMNAGFPDDAAALAERITRINTLLSDGGEHE